MKRGGRCRDYLSQAPRIEQCAYADGRPDPEPSKVIKYRPDRSLPIWKIQTWSGDMAAQFLP